MPDSSFYQFANNMSALGVQFFYQGVVTESVLESVGEALRYTLKSSSETAGVDKAAFAVFVEQVQNVIRYAEDCGSSYEQDDAHAETASHGAIRMGGEDGHFYIECGNKVSLNRAQSLQKTLEELQSMSRGELKSLYKTKLRQAPSPDSLGAGVGLIDMALRAKHGFEFNFEKLDDETQFFSLKIRL